VTYLDPVVSPFNPEVQDFEPQTLPLDEIIRRANLAAGLNLHVWLPAQIVKINGNQSVDIQLLLQTRLLDGTVITRPVIQHVPVEMPNGNGWSIKLPIAVGDTGRACFADRSLDVWLASQGGIVDPQDSRQHDISDACFVPGLVPFSKQTQDTTTDMVLTNGSAVLKLQKAGTFLATNGTNELLNLLVQITTEVHDLSNTLANDTVNTIFGPEPLNSFTTYQNIASVLQDLLNKLETLQGS
jgi:hypothetical protein